MARLSVPALVACAATLSVTTRASADTPSAPSAPSAEAGAAPTPTRSIATDPPADEADRMKRALALHDEAWRLYERGRYHAAIQRLEAAVRVDPNGAELVYNLGLLHEKLADLRTAATYFRRYIEMETDPKARVRALTTLRRIEGAEQEFESAPPPPAPVISAAPMVGPSPGPDHRRATLAAGGVAIGAVAVGVGCGVAALVRNPGSSSRTGPGETIDDLEADAHAAHGAAIAADVAFGIAAAATITAVVFYASSPSTPSAAAATAPRLFASIGPARGAVGVAY